MTTTHTYGDETVAVLAAVGPLLESEADAVEIVGSLYGTGTDIVAIPHERLTERFFVLSERVAGFFIQKLVQYGLRVVFVGDIAGYGPEDSALADFVRESNRGRHVWFVSDLDALVARLA